MTTKQVKTKKALDGSMGRFSGTLADIEPRIVSGNPQLFSGVVTRKLRTVSSLSGSEGPFSGALTFKQVVTRKSLAGSSWLSGTLVAVKKTANQETLDGTQIFSGTLASKQVVTRKALDGQLWLSGDLARVVDLRRSVDGSSWLSGDLARKANLHKSADGSPGPFSGTLAFKQVVTRKALDGSSWLSGTLVAVKKTASQVALDGNQLFSGALSIRQVLTHKALDGQISLTAILATGAAVENVGYLSMTGTVAARRSYPVGGGHLSMSGTLDAAKGSEVMYYGVANP